MPSTNFRGGVLASDVAMNFLGYMNTHANYTMLMAALNRRTREQLETQSESRPASEEQP